jgi:hypothetical protein
MGISIWEGAYTYGEGLTADGHLVKFTCRPEDVEKALEALKLFKDIEPPTTGRAKLVGHGSYGLYTRFDIHQHKYAGGRSGYIEALEIKDAPDGRCGFVIHEYADMSGCRFYEYKNMDSANAAFERSWGANDRNGELQDSPGFKRRVDCGPRQPWFYAVGDQHIAGDIVFPDCIMEDPVYRFGRKFVVARLDERPRITECVGVHLERDRHSTGPYDEKPPRRIVFFEDGTIWRERSGDPTPEPLRGDQLWIHEAILKFESFLAGKVTKFAIEFMDGRKFIGRLSQGKSPHGTYWAKVRLENGKTAEGEFRFEGAATKSAPSIEEYLLGNIVRGSKVSKILELKRRFRKHDWLGVFLPPEA